MDAAFGILGRTALRIDGTFEESWGAPRERAVLARLLIHPGRSVPIDTLIEWVWPEEAALPRNPVPTFHTYATRIRRSLSRVSVPAALVAQDRGYRLEVDKTAIDYYRFGSLMTDARTAARAGQVPDAIALASQAVELWRGPPLDDLATEPARAWRRRVTHDEWLPANHLLLEALLEVGELGAVLARLNDLQADHPYDVSLAKLRLSALHRLSRSSEATAYYFSIRRRLLEDADDQAAEHLRRHHDELRAQLPEPGPAASLAPAGQPRQLPHDVDFVGRVDLLRALDTATSRPSHEPGGVVVILDGMAGVGKTALAIHWGHLARHRFPDGELFVNLNGFSDTAALTQSRVVDDFLIALGHPPDSSLDQRSRELRLSRLLADRRMLVVLDNARNTDHIKDLIALLPSCLVIVTSRQRLSTLSAATGARRVRVEPMPPADATALLSARLGPRWQIEEADLTRLVRLCGGLPLMITMLADHIATSQATELSGFVRQLDRRQLIVDIGEDGDGSAIARTFFSWSYNRLNPPEQRLFRLLSLHPGPDIGVDVARACDGRTPLETKQSFGALVGAHLLERPILFDRYRFHDLIREFAAYRAEHDETPDSRAAAARRMLTFYLRSAANANTILYPYRIKPGALPMEAGVEPIEFTSAGEASFWFDQERSNLVAAVQFATAHGYHDHSWRLADSMTAFFDRHGFNDDSRRVRELAVTSARAAGDRDGELSSLEGLGMNCLVTGDYAEAERYFDIALRFAVEDGNEQAQATTLHHLGRLEMLRGNPARAVELYRRCLDVARDIDDQVGQTWTHCRVAEALHALDQHDQAIVHLHQAQWFAQRIGDDSAQASSLALMGSVFKDRGDVRTAQAYAEQALAVAESIPDLDITVQIYGTLAEITSERGDAEAAVRSATHAIELCQRTRNVSAEGRSHEVLGDVLFSSGDITNAVVAWQQAIRLYEHVGNSTRSGRTQAKIDKVPAGGVDLPSARAEPQSSDQGDGHAVSRPEGRAPST